MAAPRLLDAVRERVRAKHYSYLTEKAYLHWIRRFIRFHGRRHPRELDKAELEAFLTSLATEFHVSASTQDQALAASIAAAHCARTAVALSLESGLDGRR